MQKTKLKLGYAPTRRSIFSREDAWKHRKLIEEKIKGFDVIVCNLDWLNEEGLLYDSLDAERVAKRFTDDQVDAVFAPHCNFGTEDAVAKLGKKLNKPLLLWGPRDDSPLPDGTRTRDSQCGLFATSKVLQRFGVRFSYITNSRIDDEVFEKGFKNFIRASSVVKAFSNLRIGQIGTRPTAFYSVMFNEGELLEKFGIEIVPTTLVEILRETKAIIKENGSGLSETVEGIKAKASWDVVGEELLYKLAALKIAIRTWAEKEKLSAVVIQCWSALQKEFGLFPCFTAGELTGEGLPLICETDVHGAVTSVMAQAAGMNETPTFLADLTVRHPSNDNAELLWHCGPFPHCLKKEDQKARVGNSFTDPGHFPGVGEWEIKGGDITICRFDGGNGRYSLLMGHGKGVEGPKSRGTYLWVEFNNWPLWERKFIYGPYIHHITGIHGKLAPALYEACRYIPELKPDPVDPTEEDIMNYLLV